MKWNTVFNFDIFFQLKIKLRRTMRNNIVKFYDFLYLIWRIVDELLTFFRFPSISYLVFVILAFYLSNPTTQSTALLICHPVGRNCIFAFRCAAFRYAPYTIMDITNNFASLSCQISKSCVGLSYIISHLLCTYFKASLDINIHWSWGVFQVT